jgi:hypothetical protein
LKREGAEDAERIAEEEVSKSETICGILNFSASISAFSAPPRFADFDHHLIVYLHGVLTPHDRVVRGARVSRCSSSG